MSDRSNLCEYGYQMNKESFEEKLSKYKHTMEFVRTIIGFIVLGIQIFILYHLINN